LSTIGIAPALSVGERGGIKQNHAAQWVFLVDVIAVEVCLALGWILHFGTSNFLVTESSRSSFFALALGVLPLPIACASVGLYPGYRLGSAERLKRRVYATFLVFVILLGWNFLYEYRSWSAAVLLAAMSCSLVILPLCESACRQMLAQFGHWGAAAIVIGANHTGELIISKLKKDSSLGLLPVAILDDDQETWGTTIQDVPVLGPLSLADQFKDQTQIAIVSSAGLETPRLLNLVESLSFPTVILVPDLLGVQSLWTVSRDLGGVLGLEMQKNLLLPRNQMLKRALDCALAVPLLLAALPVLLLSAICIKVTNPGPAFFRQKREGLHGSDIYIWKLRTMYVNSDEILEKHLAENPQAREEWQRQYKLRRDPRVLPVIGKPLRRFSIDELPQLWAILKGDMSLVGPRPFPQYHLENFSQKFRTLRTSVTPGLTGLWQVSERSDGDLLAQEANDTYYIRNWSLWFDIYLIIRTVGRVLFPKGAY